jgi:hypothetical protein
LSKTAAEWRIHLGEAVKRKNGDRPLQPVQEPEPRPALTENGCHIIYALRSVLVPVGLGWFFGPVPVHRLPRLDDITVPEFVAPWFYGILLLGALSLGV